MQSSLRGSTVTREEAFGGAGWFAGYVTERNTLGGVSLPLLTGCSEGVTVWSRWGSGAAVAAMAVMAAALVSGCGGAAVSSAHGSSAVASHTGVPRTEPSRQSGAPRDAAEPLTVTGPMVALGDSYTAGDLLPISLTSKPFGCLRSSDAYPAQVAKALGASADLIDASCTGAGVTDMTQPQRTYMGTNPPQLSVLAPDDSVVMLTLGGDDMGFMHSLDTCMQLSVTDPFGSPCERHFTSGGTGQFATKVAAEGPKIVTVLDEIHARAPRARILLVGYPDLFPQQGGCWPIVPITDGDISYLRGIETQLNATLADAARTAGATFVNTYTPTIGHDFCQSSKVKDVEGLVPTSLAAPFHPNARGQSAIAALVLAALHTGQGQAAAQ
jgi:lysophospholipase L1-like esterase